MPERIDSYTSIVDMDSSGFVAGAEKARKAAENLSKAQTETQRVAKTSITESQFENRASRYDSELRAQRELAKQWEYANKAVASGAITQAQAAQFIENVEQKLRKVNPQLAATGQGMRSLADSTKLTQFQMMTLQYTFNDVVASLASGASPLTILLQQGGQVTQAWGGLGNTLRALLTPARLAVVAFGSLAAAMTASVLYDNTVEKRFLDMEVALKAVGKQGQLSRAQLADFEQQIKQTANVSSGDARKIEQTLISNWRIGSDAYVRLTALAADYARVTGTTVPEAMEKLTSYFGNSAKTMDQLHKEYDLFDKKQYRLAKGFEDSGKYGEAFKLLLSGLEERFSGVAKEGLDPLTESLRDLRISWENLAKTLVESGIPKFFVDLSSFVLDFVAGIEKGARLIPTMLDMRKELRKPEIDREVFEKAYKRIEDSSKPPKPLTITVHPGSYTNDGGLEPTEAEKAAAKEQEKAFEKIIESQAKINKLRFDGFSALEREKSLLKEEGEALLTRSDKELFLLKEKQKIANLSREHNFSKEETDQAIADTQRLASANYDLEQQKKAAHDEEVKRIEQINSLTKTLSSTLASAFVEGKDAAETFRQFYLKMIEELIAKSVIEPIIRPLVSNASDFFSSGGGSLFSFLGDAVFSGFRATGGEGKAGRSYVVGENGPEMFTPGMNGSFSPMKSGVTNSFNFNVTVSGPAASNSRQAENSGVLLAQAARGEILKILQDERRPGGALWSPA